MASTKYADLISDVLPLLAADPSDPVTESAIKRAVIQFCAKSWVWQHIPDNIALTANESTYDLTAPPGSDVVVVMSATLDGIPFDCKSVEWLDENMPKWRTDTAQEPAYFTQVDMDQVIVTPIPTSSSTEATGIALTLALQPSQKSTNFPKWIATRYLYDIVDGALAYLMMIPGVAWSDPKMAMFYDSRFKDAIANARADSVMGLGRAPIRTTSSH